MSESQAIELKIDDRLKQLDRVKFGITCRTIEVLLANGQTAAAINELRKFAQDPERPFATMDSPFSDVFSTRLANQLEAEGYETLIELEEESIEELKRCENIGERAVKVIKETIWRIRNGKFRVGYGLSQAEESDLYGFEESEKCSVVIMVSQEVADRLAQAEPIIRAMARRYSSQAVPPEDFEQELRLVMLNAANSFDESKAKWTTWASFKAQKGAIDICRKYGYMARNGTQNKLAPIVASQVIHDQRFDSNKEPETLEPADFGDHESEVEWAELEQAARAKGPEVLAAYWHVSGVTMKTIGQRLNLSESRISQLLSESNSARLVNDLIDHEFRHVIHDSLNKTTQTPQQVEFKEKISMNDNPTLNSPGNISDAVGLLLDAPDSAVKEIDDRIDELTKQISRLRSMKKMLGAKSAKASGAGQNIDLASDKWKPKVEKVKQFLRAYGQPAKPGEIARETGVPTLNVGRIVKASDELEKHSDGRVALKA